MFVVPAAKIVTVLPLTVATVVLELANVIGKPDAPPVALRVNAALPINFAGNGRNVTVWLALLTVSVCETSGAALNVASPAWLAVMVEVPAPTMVTVPPETVATAALLEV